MEAAQDDVSIEESGRHETQMRLARMQLEGWLRDLADNVIPQTIRALASEADDKTETIRSILSDFFAAGGSYARSRIDIATLLLGIEPELLVDLEDRRNKLNEASNTVLDENLEQVSSTLRGQTRGIS